MATSKDVAKIAGVSHTTVSRAFRGDVNMKKDTYDRVMTAAAELGYTPNRLASSLKQRRSMTIGLIISDISNPFFMIIAEKLERSINKLGYRLLISFDSYDFAKQQKAIKAMIASQTEIIIFMPVSPEYMPAYINNPDLKFIQLFQNFYPKLSYIHFNDYRGAFIGTKHLLEKGHKKISFIGGADRVGGFFDACENSGAEISHLTNFDFSNERAIIETIKAEIANKNITAIFAVGNDLGRMSYEAIKQLGLKCPKDASLLVFDDLQWTKMLDISVISHPIEELTETLVNELLMLLKGSNEPISEMFEPFLIERSSVKDLRG